MALRDQASREVIGGRLEGWSKEKMDPLRGVSFHAIRPIAIRVPVYNHA